jgi:hypothetical protein
VFQNGNDVHLPHPPARASHAAYDP